MSIIISIIYFSHSACATFNTISSPHIVSVLLTPMFISRKVSLLRSTLVFISHTGCNSQPGFTCPQYVEEGSRLDCVCTAPSDGGTSTPVFTWPGHSETPQLVVNNVSRILNGTQYTCQMTVNGVSTTIVYTLQVACK